MGVTASRAEAIESRSLRKLRDNPTFRRQMQPYRDSIAYSIGIRHTNFKQTHESSTERAAFKLMGVRYD